MSIQRKTKQSFKPSESTANAVPLVYQSINGLDALVDSGDEGDNGDG